MAIDPEVDERPRGIDVDARQQYSVFLEASKQFLNVPGGGVKVLAALIELFDVMLSKAPSDTQRAFWDYTETKMDAARSQLDAPVLVEPESIM